ncbi:MAG: hypothetical protein AB203_02645 [Parcubacteria bacterium C7867-008]|nr:MAG: hypothetical protein AB203_02645 [Parcubacteria bacterium C7867-008]
MNNNSQHDQFQNEVLERIRSGQLQMKPRLFFVLKSVCIILITVFILLISVWLVSFISFGLRLTGNESLLGFGAKGSLIFLVLFPWWLALLDLGLVALLAWLVRRFSFGYRRPLLYLLIALTVCGAASGLLFDRETRFHDDRFEEAEAGELFGPLESLYESAHLKAPEEHGVYRGFVLDIGERSFTLTHDDNDNDEDDGEWTVLPPTNFDMKMIRIGDRVYVAGEREDQEIEAYGLRILDR